MCSSRVSCGTGLWSTVHFTQAVKICRAKFVETIYFFDIDDRIEEHNRLRSFLHILICRTSTQTDQADFWAPVLVVIQFVGHLPRQLEATDEAVQGSVMRNRILGINDLQDQPTLLLIQPLNEFSGGQT